MAQFNLEEYLRMFNVELPKCDTMDEYLDFILGHIRPLGEDLVEEEYWMSRRWMEIRDDSNFHEAVLHIFQPGGAYMISLDGNVSKGAWSTMTNTNTLILEHGNRRELYDLAFLNETFFVLKKHGDQRRKGHPKYFVMGFEAEVNDLQWRDSMELLFNVYRNNSRWTTWLFGIVIVLALVLALSFL